MTRTVLAGAFVAVSLLASSSGCSKNCTTGNDCTYISGSPIDQSIEVSVTTSKQQFRATENVTVTVTAKNISPYVYGIPRQSCQEPVDFVKDGTVYPVVVVCNGETYSAGVVNPGKSITFTRNLVPLIQKAIGSVAPGEYCMYGRVTNADRMATSDTYCVQILP